MNETEVHQDMADFKPLSKEQEDEILLLELNRLCKKGAISEETILRTMAEWRVLISFDWAAERRPTFL